MAIKSYNILRDIATAENHEEGEGGGQHFKQFCVTSIQSGPFKSFFYPKIIPKSKNSNKNII